MLNPVGERPVMPRISVPWNMPSGVAGSTVLEGNSPAGSPGVLPITRKPAEPPGGMAGIVPVATALPFISWRVAVPVIGLELFTFEIETASNGRLNADPVRT